MSRIIKATKIDLVAALNANSHTRESLDRRIAIGTLGTSTGRIYGAAIALQRGDVINSLTLLQGGSGQSGATHRWFALLDLNFNVLGLTADDTSASWTANTLKTLSLTAAYTATYSGLYYGCMASVATTPGSIVGIASQSNLQHTVTPVLTFLGNQTGLTDPASLTTPVATTISTVTPWFGVK